MNSTRAKCDNSPRGRRTLAYLIIDSLGYCCLDAFFSRYTDTALIAARLGVTTRAVRVYKARWKAGGFPKCKEK